MLKNNVENKTAFLYTKLFMIYNILNLQIADDFAPESMYIIITRSLRRGKRILIF